MSFDNYRAGGEDSLEAQWQRERERRDAPRRIPVDGALAALRERMSDLAKLVNGSAARALYTDAMAAVECLALAIEQAQSAERGAVPLHVATSDASIEARAKAAYETWEAGVRDTTSAAAGNPFLHAETVRRSPPPLMSIWQTVVRAVDASRPDPEHARVTMTPIDRLRVIAGLVMTLPHGKASHEVALGHDEHAFAMLSEAGATVACNDLGDVGIILRATLHLDGVRFTAQKDGEGVST